MAATSGKKTSSSNKRGRKPANSKGTRNSKSAQQIAQDGALFHEIGLIVLFVAMAILFCCNFGIIGPVGNYISGILFGLFGLTAYVAPILLFLAIAFWFANEGNPNAMRKLISGAVLFVMLGVVFDLIGKNATSLETYDIVQLYNNCKDGRMGGGVIAGSLTYLLHHYLETLGTILVVFLCASISLILLTEKSLISGVRNSGERIGEMRREGSERRREYAQMRRMEQEEVRSRRDEERRLREEERRLREEERENEKILRMERKVSGVMMDTALTRPEDEKRRDDMHEITFSEEVQEEYTNAVSEEYSSSIHSASSTPEFDFDKIQIRSAHQLTIDTVDEMEEEIPTYEEPMMREEVRNYDEPPVQNATVSRPRPKAKLPERPEGAHDNPIDSAMQNEIQSAEKKIPKKYMFPPLSRLQKGVNKAGDSTKELKETAMRLQQTLNTFGVKVTITDISQGPSVTRYELQPEQGVKVSKIVGLTDDIKLNLAATDIRIEAPIPGKAAIGIEVPNKENMAVALRDLLESKEFKEFPSNIAFAVGRDISGQVVVTDIAKMPHMLIAGATGSGKSVCINTLIMSILYKAHPDDVKLIMIDPKVVELSVYNGIPHLLIPVVTDPKKASAALHWGVAEMEDRYRKFADFNVRDLKGYNKKVETMQESDPENAPKKMPQIVIIVDELADLMMVAPGEVEESICRLAQLARAAGIHLIIATQRPSVDVITGLIKANMPSRVAFSVSSGVDSRTILDMNGAEKLLGKGDMLFYPQGYTKPARIQGAFVSDKEVSDVVDFLKNQAIGNTYAEDIEEKIKSIGSSSGAGGVGGSGSDRDEYFADAGRFVIDKDKASIGMLQRVLKIGFNRAARIMDQLCEYGVVGEEEGTKPRKVLMSLEQFEQLLEEI